MKTSKFKMTEIGEIPADWEVKRLGNIGEPLMCKRILKSQTSEVGDIPFYKIGTFGKVADAYIPYQLFNSFKHQYSYPRKGDILLSAAGTIGRTVVFDGHDSYFQDSNIVWIDNDERIVTNDYLKWFYCVIDWVTEDGGIVTRLYNNNVRNALVSCPPLAEQKAIAEALSDVDALIAAQEELIEKKRAIKQGEMQELLTGKKRLPGFGGKCRRSLRPLRDKKSPTENAEIAEFKQTELGEIPVDWEVKDFDDCFQIRSNNTYARAYMTDFTMGVGNIHYGDVLIKYNSVVDVVRDSVPSLIDEIKRPGENLDEGDLVFADTAEDDTVGKAVEVRNLNGRKVVPGLHTVACHPKFEFAPGWLGYWINSSDYHDQLLPLVTGIKVSSVSKASFRQTKILIPSLAEQKAIAEVLSDMDAEISELEAQKAKFESIKQGMMQELLTGKTRLV